ncbi:FAD-dependent monooxygenase [Kitasatospora brasiliensis]|uniref:FAD-dependent monooxygenase n=1 Tax=Kitasatospora brasiliensis TaxID=3058040 RepID=UPI002931E872|nr:FAD-dependent monooxygenase [Kitasatospora sp. K002]
MIRQASVLIAGGGPVGMLLAAELGARGIGAVVVEPHPRTQDTPRAGTLHARSVQSLLRRGYLRLHGRGSLEEMQETSFHFGGSPILRIATPTAEGPPIHGQSQASLEQAFEARARELGAAILRGHRFTGLRQDPDGVTATIEGPDGPYELTADYLVGCDGARSDVRRAAGFACTTHEATFAAIVGLVRLRDPYSVPPGWTHTAEGWLLANVHPAGHSRIITHDFRLPLPERGSPATLEELQRTLSRILGRPVALADPTYLDRFSDFTRVADRYRAGRVLLAGDAAHVHAPLGGQGLNTGLQDAFNLGWKLALVARGEADARLLDTYDAERRPVAEAVVANTRVQAAVMRPGPENDHLREFTARMFRHPGVNREAADVISGQGIAYPPEGATDPAVGRFLPNLALRTPDGVRTVVELLTPGRPLVLLRPEVADALEPVAARWGERVAVLRVEPEPDSAELRLGPGAPLPWSALVCRPDGYLAWRGVSKANTTGLREALADWFGPVPERVEV